MNHEDRRSLRSDLLDDLNIPKDGEPSPTEHQNIHDGLRVVERALEQWREGILEPLRKTTAHPILDRYIKKGTEWTWIKSYQNRKLAWCGHFAGFCWRESVSTGVRRSVFPSTWRMYDNWKGTEREIDTFLEAQPGDIIIVGDKKPWGDHITLLERIEEDGTGFWTIEGNAFGETPQGPKKEGVIRRFREKSEIRFIYRPLEMDR